MTAFCVGGERRGEGGGGAPDCFKVCAGSTIFPPPVWHPAQLPLNSSAPSRGTGSARDANGEASRTAHAAAETSEQRAARAQEGPAVEHCSLWCCCALAWTAKEGLARAAGRAGARRATCVSDTGWLTRESIVWGMAEPERTSAEISEKSELAVRPFEKASGESGHPICLQHEGAKIWRPRPSAIVAPLRRSRCQRPLRCTRPRAHARSQPIRVTK